MTKNGKTKNTLSPTAQLFKYGAIGAFASVICCIVFSLAAAYVIGKADLPHRTITPIALVILGASCFIGGIIAARLHYKKGLLLGITTAAITFALICIADFFLPDDSSLSLVPIKAVIILVASVLGSVIGVNVRKKWKY